MSIELLPKQTYRGTTDTDEHQATYKHTIPMSMLGFGAISCLFALVLLTIVIEKKNICSEDQMSVSVPEYNASKPVDSSDIVDDDIIFAILDTKNNPSEESKKKFISSCNKIMQIRE